MKRAVRQYFIGLVGVGGLLLFVIFMLHDHLSSSSSSSISSPLLQGSQPSYAELSRKLQSIEEDLQSQIHLSNLLLQRVKETIDANATQQKAVLHKLEVEKDKLKRLLQQEAHQGEVDSGAAEDVKIPPAHDENGAHEVLEDQVEESVIAILVFVCNRPTVTRCLDRLLQYRSSKTRFPIIVTQDCGQHKKTIEALKPYEKEFLHIYQPNLEPVVISPGHAQYTGYYKIARHYGWALNYVFNELKHSNVIIVEDDLEVAPDFFEYFSATLPLLRSDPSLWCVSAWNDNGKANRINGSAPELLYRTDFFPGLGWMLTKELWQELGPKWPNAFWDDWMREPPQRKERSCIRPEISRTSTFGKIGVSLGTYFQSHLKFIKLNDKPVKFTSMDLSYLTKEKYDDRYLFQVNSAVLLGSVEELTSVAANTDDEKEEYRLTYSNNAMFRSYAKQLQIMDDLRAGVPRTAYKGVVTTMFANHRIYLNPEPGWNGYTM